MVPWLGGGTVGWARRWYVLLRARMFQWQTCYVTLVRELSSVGRTDNVCMFRSDPWRCKIWHTILTFRWRGRRGHSVPGETQEQAILTSHGELDDAIHDTPIMTRIRRGAVVCCDSYQVLRTEVTSESNSQVKLMMLLNCHWF